MAGFREFVTGEVLTASNVDDFLAKQAVMKFADSAARDSALGTAVAGGNALREGMVAYLDDEDEVQYFDGTAWDAISQPSAGIGSNVVQASITTAFSTTSSSFVDVTGYTVTITPSSDTSKVLVFTSFGVAGSGAAANQSVQLLRGSTPIDVAGVGPGNYNGNFFRNTLTTLQWTNGYAGMFLDSPATATAVTYKMQAKTSAGTLFVGRADNSDSYRYVATMCAIEVAA